jgi:hypothetical protein
VNDASYSPYIQTEHTVGGKVNLSFGTTAGNVLPDEKMIITSGGNIGIGVASASTKLHRN